MTDMNELREKVAKVIGHTACLGNYGINNAWEVADAAIATVMEATGWQDIATAPRDGAPILMCNNFYDQNGFLPIAVRWRTYHPNATGEPTWRTSDGQKVNGFHFWMPLPPPPFEGTKP